MLVTQRSRQRAQVTEGSPAQLGASEQNARPQKTPSTCDESRRPFAPSGECRPVTAPNPESSHRSKGRDAVCVRTCSQGTCVQAARGGGMHWGRTAPTPARPLPSSCLRPRRTPAPGPPLGLLVFGDHPPILQTPARGSRAGRGTCPLSVSFSGGWRVPRGHRPWHAQGPRRHLRNDVTGFPLKTCLCCFLPQGTWTQQRKWRTRTPSCGVP